MVKVRRTMWRVSGSWESKAARVSASFAPLTGSSMSWMQPVQHQPMSPSLLALVPTSITLMQTGRRCDDSGKAREIEAGDREGRALVVLKSARLAAGYAGLDAPAARSCDVAQWASPPGASRRPHR